MNIKEELKKSVPYKSVKNIHKKSYDHSSDENDLEMGFPIQENVRAYNILKDQQGLSKIKQILEGTQLQEYNLYQYLTIFEELAIILHFASHQNDTFIKKVKQLSQKLGRDEKFLSDYIVDISYFNRFTQNNFNLLIKKLKQNTELTLISRIKWTKQSSSTSNAKANQQEYFLEVSPNTLKNILNDNSSSLMERQSINSEQIYLEGQNSFNQKELSQFFLNQDHNEKFQKAKDLFQNKVKQLRKNPVNTYFDSDSNDNDQNNNTSELNKKQIFSQQGQNFVNINYDDEKKFKEILESENDSQEQKQQKEEDKDEDYQQIDQKNKNSLNALLAKVIQFDGQEQSDASEQNQQEIEFQKFPFDSMMCDNLMSLSEYQKCIENIQKNQKQSVKEFLLKKTE
ncbi:hypothetical protein ABPG74_013518 [Tetrahymena malaccensis]